ncbi:MAG: cobyrinate a,c-diamide synthase [Cyanobacteria bacterium P01_F01_bin.33]
MAFAIAAPSSGSGKTTLTLAILAALKRRGFSVASFKVGPDYIDPTFHAAATGTACHNLDPFLTSEAYIRKCFAYHCRGASAAVVEGVMGLFDGKAGTSGFASTAHVAKVLELPVILVLDAARIGGSAAAIAYGFKHYDPAVCIAGIICNRVASPRHAEILTEAIASLDIPLIGCIPTTPDIRLPSRHLGLVPADENRELSALFARLSHLAETYLNWEYLLPLIAPPKLAPIELWGDMSRNTSSPRIAVARDRAFNFYYADNLDLLTHLGAELIYFSPLQDGFAIANACDGAYLGGGFPELWAARLSEQWRELPCRADIPIYAECGGLMVLGRSLQDLDGETYLMGERLPYSVTMTEKLRLGYREAIAQVDTPLVRTGDRLRGHEFHHSTCSPSPQPIYDFGQAYEGWRDNRIHASYLHLHWGEQTYLAARWLQQCLQSTQFKEREL